MASVGLASKGRTREELAQALCVVDCLTELGVDVLDGLTRAKA